jgi:DNA-binding NarL/FixJ family response regulator
MANRILLVDDHRVLREGLRSVLEKQPEFEVVGEAGDGQSALTMVREHRPDVVVMDVSMPGMDGIDATRQIMRDYPGTKVLALSMYLRKAFVQEMFKSGASGYLLKENPSAEVVEAIKTVLSGARYASRKVVDLLVGEMAPGQMQTPTKVPLTDRERTVVRMLANGRTSKEIALTLDTSSKTIDACRRQAMQKLEVKSLAELVKYAIREGLTNEDA